MKLPWGALGTMGVIVAASCKVFAKPLHDVAVESANASMDEAWAAWERALTMPMAPSAVELFSNGRVLARFLGSHDATRRTIADLGWTKADGSVWIEHSKAAPKQWARIATPRHQLRSIVDQLGADQKWWASPGTGIANWEVAGGAEEGRVVRAAAVPAGGPPSPPPRPRPPPHDPPPPGPPPP